MSAVYAIHPVLFCHGNPSKLTGKYPRSANSQSERREKNNSELVTQGIQILELLHRMFEMFRANIITKETHKKITVWKEEIQGNF